MSDSLHLLSLMASCAPNTFIQNNSDFNQYIASQNHNHQSKGQALDPSKSSGSTDSESFHSTETSTPSMKPKAKRVRTRVKISMLSDEKKAAVREINRVAAKRHRVNAVCKERAVHMYIEDLGSKNLSLKSALCDLSHQRLELLRLIKETRESHNFQNNK